MFVSKSNLLIGTVVVLVAAVMLNAFLKWAWSVPGVIQYPESEYDYIIVGGGTAGSVLTRRLSENRRNSILLIEAGGFPPFIGYIPFLAPALQGTSIDWAFKTVPQKSSQRGMNRMRSAWPRGRALGGSSAINYLLHMWGTRTDFDTFWAEKINSTEWNFKNVLPYFQMSERYRNSFGLHSSASSYRGKDGILPVQEFHASQSVFAQAFLEGAASLGLQVGDLNGDIENGIMFSQSNVENGYRITTFDAYVRPYLGKRNISVVINSLVSKILFDHDTAVGLEMMNVYTLEKTTVFCRKEIIISAGAIGTPQLLLLSGVGPKKQLQKLKIPVVADLPGVGHNLQDQLNLPMYFHLDAPVSINTAKARSIKEVWKHFVQGEGVLNNTGVEVIARTSSSGKNSSVADIMYLVLNVGSINKDLFTSIANYKEQVFLETFPDTHNDSKEGFVILSTCTYPKSKGEVILTSTNPMAPPFINPHYLEDNEDVRCFLKAMKMGARLGVTKPLRSLGSRLHLPGYSQCEQHEQSLENDEYLKCWLKIAAMTSYHPIGTCAMGSDSDPMAVLDSEFRVRKLRNLRVVDASAMPRHPAGTPHAVVVMMAEKAADFIRSSIAYKRNFFVI